jgi:hypothetical protein
MEYERGRHPLKRVTEEDLRQFFESPIYAYLHDVWDELSITWTNTLKNLSAPDRALAQAQGAMLILDHDTNVESVVRGEVQSVQIQPEDFEGEPEEDPYEDELDQL